MIKLRDVTCYMGSHGVTCYPTQVNVPRSDLSQEGWICGYVYIFISLEGHFSLGCHFHVHFSNLWQAFTSHSLPAIAEFLVVILFHHHMICCTW